MHSTIRVLIAAVILWVPGCALEEAGDPAAAAAEQGGPRADGPRGLSGCFVGGCSAQLCTDSPEAISTCEWRPWYACYRGGTCEAQASGQCGWTPTAELCDCVAEQGGSLEGCEPSPPGDCYVGGCSGQLCSDDPSVISTCEWRPWYVCFRGAHCAAQSTGQCGWTPDAELCACVSEHGGSIPGCS